MRSYISESQINHYYEMLMAVEEYLSRDNITVIFENGHREKTTYRLFKEGLVKIKTVKNGKDAPKSKGCVFKDRNGEDVTVLKTSPGYNKREYMTVVYEDGTVLSRVPGKDIRNGNFDRHYWEEGEKEFSCENYAGHLGHAAEWDRTYKNVIWMLRHYGSCFLSRPCGFGKTTLAAYLFRMHGYTKCLFVYPNNDSFDKIKMAGHKTGKKIDFMTYAKLRSLGNDQLKKMDYDVVFFDEVHMVGGDEEKEEGAVKTYAAVKKLMTWHPLAHFVGATATPFRTDGINVAKCLFNNHRCYPYTDIDAFEDGILKRPNYFPAVYGAAKQIVDKVTGERKKTFAELTREELKQIYGMTEEEAKAIDARYMDQHIKKYCSELFPGTRYMRFIVFYRTNAEIKKEKDKVIKWFQKAYPDFQVDSMIVTGCTRKGMKDVDALDRTVDKYAPWCDGKIDLVFNCEKLCRGYHSKLLNGIIMERKTQSLNKYLQMVGRVLSCDNDNPMIVFDLADNLNSEFLYEPSGLPAKSEKLKPARRSKRLTFNEVYNLNPYAVHWEKVDANNEEVVDDISAPDPEDDNNEMPVNNEVAKKHSVHYIPRPTYTSCGGGDPMSVSGIFAPEPDDEGLGYKACYEYDSRTRDMWSKNVILLGKPIEDYAEEVKNILNKMDDKVCERVITEWLKFPGCMRYTSIEAIDRTSTEFKILRECTDIYGNSRSSVDRVIKYMIGEAA